MTTTDLQKRAEAVFKWAPGMLSVLSRDVDGSVRACWRVTCACLFPEYLKTINTGVMDLTDPATIGCMWAQVMACLPAPSPDSEFAMSLNEALFLTSSYGPLHPKVVPYLIAAKEAAPK